MIPFEILQSLPEDVAVTLMTFSGPVGLSEELQRRCHAVHVMDTRGRAAAMVRSAFGIRGLGKHLRATREALSTAQRLSAQNDVTLIHGPHAVFLARHIAGPLVLQTVDPWSIRAKMDGALVPRGLRAGYRLREHLALRAERRLPLHARLLTVGAHDAQAWSERLKRPVRSIPNGAGHVLRPAQRSGPPVACFVGSLNYGPNVDSVKVLIGTIAPLVWAQVPEATFVIAGRQPDPEVLHLAGPRVTVLPNVASVVEVFHGADVAVFADEHGVGVRNSVREALAAGTPVVATPVAAREQQPHPLLFVERDTPEFVARVVSLLTGPRNPLPGDVAAVRTWKDATDEYLDELAMAIKAEGHRPPQPDSSPSTTMAP